VGHQRQGRVESVGPSPLTTLHPDKLDFVTMAERPLILLLDDRPEARESMRALFEAIGCSVIPVATYESAFAEISSRENINFVVTDISLKADENDKSGVIFAKMARKMREDIPVAAYSAKVKDLALSPADYRVFDLFLDKTSDKAEHTMQFVTECRALAIAHNEMSKRLPGKIELSSDTKLRDLESRLSKVETTYLRKPDFKRYARALYVGIALVGGIASILGLYFVLR
jgi:CheY-like chemotaxis protein